MNVDGLFVPPDNAMQFEIKRAANMLTVPVTCVWVMGKLPQICSCGCGCQEMYPVYRESIPPEYRKRSAVTGPGRGGYVCDCMGRIIE